MLTAAREPRTASELVKIFKTTNDLQVGALSRRHCSDIQSGIQEGLRSPAYLHV